MRAPQRISHPGTFNGYRAVGSLVAVRTIGEGTVTLTEGESISAERVATVDLDRLVADGFLAPIGASRG